MNIINAPESCEGDPRPACTDTNSLLPVPVSGGDLNPHDARLELTGFPNSNCCKAMKLGDKFGAAMGAIAKQK